MSYVDAVGVLMFAWGAGFVLGFKIRQISDAVNAI